MDVQEQAPRPPLTGEDNGVDDDPPTLSPYALEALKAFLAEQNAIGGATTSSLEEEEKEEKVRLLSEDWRLSQFWYAPETAETVAKEVLYLCSNEVAESTAAVACIACPTLFAYLKEVGIQVWWSRVENRTSSMTKELELHENFRFTCLPTYFL